LYVCVCHAVTEHDLREQVACGAVDPAAVAVRCGAGTSCGSCTERICALLRELRRDAPLTAAAGF
jgi:bacterioferritin-associated ferredoxin